MTPARLFAALSLLLGLALPALGQDTKIFVDDAGREIEIPAHPQRIVSLHDTFITLPMIELGIHPIASLGRENADGEPYIRSARMLTGVDYDNSDIAFLGGIGMAEAETILSFEPDLILASANETNIDQLSQIAPTIQFETGGLDTFAIYEQIAEITGTERQLDILKARYEAQLAQIASVAAPAETSVSAIGFAPGEIIVYNRWGSLGRVLHDAGFRVPPSAPDIELGQVARGISLERLTEMDADLLIVTYRAETGETPDDVIAQLESIDPGFCNRLEACRTGRMVALPRDETFASSYNALSMMAYAMLALSTPARLSD